MNRGFTLIELLVVVAVLAILVALLLPLFTNFTATKPFEARVIDKWTDLDGDGGTLYRVRTQAADGEVNTYNSFWVHSKIQNGLYYRFVAKGQFLSTVETMPQPVEVQAQTNEATTN